MGERQTAAKKNLIGSISLNGPLGESKTFLNDFKTLMVQELSVGWPGDWKQF